MKYITLPVDLKDLAMSLAYECKECKGCGMIFERVETNERM